MAGCSGEGEKPNNGTQIGASEAANKGDHGSAADDHSGDDRCVAYTHRMICRIRKRFFSMKLLSAHLRDRKGYALFEMKIHKHMHRRDIMRKCYNEIIVATILLIVMLLSACGRSDEKNTENDSTDSSKPTLEQTTTSQNEKEERILDGFYNGIKSEEPFFRVDFEVINKDNGYRAVFYSQYTAADLYECGKVLFGEKVGEKAYQFSNEFETYTVSWDGEDKLHIEGTCFNGDYERGAKDGYGENDYTIPDIAPYAADQNTAHGIEIDSTLASAVRNELGYEKEHCLTLEDLESITSLYIFDEPVTTIKGVSLLKNLCDIRISSGYIEDISELATLENLITIDIANCHIKEIPDLSGCHVLTSLYLSGNMIEDISPIADIPSLRYVSLEGNDIRSIEPLKNVENIEMLAIQSNCILDYATIHDNPALISAIDSGSQSVYAESLDMENRAKQIVASLPDGLNALQTEAAVYQYVMENMVYEEALRPAHAYGYSGLVEGKGVCGDYAEMFCLLANHAGIDAYLCHSDDHAWNIVKIDEKYYHCDPLWDDGMAEWSHFNRSTGYMFHLPSHMYDVRKYPTCNESMSILEYSDYFDAEQMKK